MSVPVSRIVSSSGGVEGVDAGSDAEEAVDRAERDDADQIDPRQQSLPLP